MKSVIRVFILFVTVTSLSSCLKTYACYYTDDLGNRVVVHLEAISDQAAVKKAESNDGTEYYWDTSGPEPVCIIR